jgi:hypothetical protein
MTANQETQDLAYQDNPGDIPVERPESLDRLDALTGTWDMEATFHDGFFGPGSPAMTARSGQTTFAWLEGQFFLTQRFIHENPAAPSGLAIIGAGADPQTFTQHYYDSRGVARTYQMTVADDGTWTVWREAPGFWQRYIGRISPDRKMITGAWEGSADGETWKHDFSLNYIKTDPAD